MVDKDDWRRMGQEEFLAESTLLFIEEFVPFSEQWDHEHCCFCWAKFGQCDQDLHSGYCTNGQKQSYWICAQCFQDFKDEFKWSVL